MYLQLNAQTIDTTIVNTPIELDSIAAIDSLIIDSTLVIIDEPLIKIHLPRKATIYSAVLPGLGQIYNKQIWKVPIIYGGFVGLGWLVQYNHIKYLDYKRSYFELNDSDLETDYYNEILDPDNLSPIDELAESSSLNDRIVNNIDFFSRRRNVLIIGLVGFYLFNILDANVTAHLIDFDISEDLTLNFEPVAIDPLTNTPILGATFTYNF